MPIFIFTCFCFAIFAYFVTTFPEIESPALQAISLIEILGAATLFLWSYVGTVFRDPGFLPFSWAASRRSKYSWEEMMSGTVTSAEQLSYIHAVPRPPGCSFSRSSGRYVIRADHICVWVSTWVAKRNHKQFILFLAWGSVLGASLFGWRFATLRPFMEVHPDWIGTVSLVAIVIDAASAITLGGSAVSFFVEALSNRTKIQRMKGEGAPPVSRMEALRQICGNGTICAWPWPTAAFGDDIELEEAPEQGDVD
jgi:hypothetical protein